ncbi:hypothetical protein L1887_61884 [Cichorium endivia]|nr:hypothetical protein L1887_61884 [Cichorium endivia]
MGSSRGSMRISFIATCAGWRSAYTIALATSLVSRILAPVGSPYFLMASWSELMPSSSVAVLPGCTDVTRRPVPAVSSRSDCSVASTKNLDALYTPEPREHLATSVGRDRHNMTCAARQQPRQRGREHVEKPLAVDVHRLLPLAHLHVVHHGKVHHAGARDDDVDRTERVRSGLHERLDLRAVNHVGLVHVHLGSHRPSVRTGDLGQLLLQLLERFDAASCERDVRTLAHERLGHRRADTRRGARDDGHLAAQREVGVECQREAVGAVGFARRRAGHARWLALHPAAGIPVAGVGLEQLGIHLGTLEVAERRTRGVVLERNDAQQELFRGHAGAQDVDGEAVVATLGRATRLVPERHPRLPAGALGRVAERVEELEEQATVDGLAVAEVVDGLIGVDVVADGDDAAADKVDGGHLDVPVGDFGRDAEVDRLDDERGDEVVRVGGASLGVSAERANADDVGGQATLGGFEHELLGHPLGLAIAIEQLLWDFLERHDGGFGPSGLGGRQNAIGRDVLDGGVAEEGEAQDLARAFDVGVAQSCVRVDEVDLCGAVDDDVDALDEVVVDLGHEAESVAREVGGKHVDAVEHGVIPDAEVEHVATQTRHGGGSVGAVGSVEADEADDARRGVLEEVVQQKSAEEAGGAGEQDGLGLAERARCHRFGRGELELGGEFDVGAQHRGQVGLDGGVVAVSCVERDADVTCERGIAGEIAEGHGEASERLGDAGGESCAMDLRLTVSSGAGLRGARVGAAGGSDGGARVGEVLEVDLARDLVGGERVEHYPERGDHVVGEMRDEQLACAGAVTVVVDGEHGAAGGVALVRHDVGYELAFETFSVRDDGAVADVKVVDDGLFDGAGHDRIAADLDHATDATRDFEEAGFGDDSGEIAGPVLARVGSGGKGVGGEGLCGGLDEVEVAACEEAASDKELAGLSGLDGILVLVEDVGVCRVHGRADGAVRGVVGEGGEHLAQIAACDLVGFAGAVAVEDAGVGESADGSAGEIGGDDLAVEPEGAEGRELCAEVVVACEDGGEEGGSHEGFRDLLVCEKLDEFDGVVGGVVGDGVGGGAAEEGAKHLPDEIDVASHAVARLEVVDGEAEVVGANGSVVWIGDALGLSCRAGRVGDKGETVEVCAVGEGWEGGGGGRRGSGGVEVLLEEGSRAVWRVDMDGGDRLGDELCMLRLGYDHGGLGVLDNLVEEAERVGEFEDEEGASSAEGGEACDDVVCASAHEDADERVAADGMVGAKVEGEAVDLCIELGVCVVCLGVDEGDGVGRCLDLATEERVEVECGVEDAHFAGGGGGVIDAVW